MDTFSAKDKTAMILSLEAVTFSYSAKSNNVFSGVSFELDSGQALTVLGPNGSGKSTLLNCIMGLYKLKSGQIALSGQNIAVLKRKEISRLVGCVSQSISSDIGFTVREYILMGCSPHLSVFSRPKAEFVDKTTAVIDRLHLNTIADKPLSNISGGERQKASIARVLLQDPRLILFDEPTAHLDFGNQIEVLQLIANLADDGYAVIMTTHNPEHALMLGGLTGVLDRRGVFTVDEPENVITEENLRRIYDSEMRLINIQAINRTVCVPPMLKRKNNDYRRTGE